ncbi:hypothetical protein EUGRSUZ_H00569 [Eucalyptus grandis]|uniref:Uncharacterized protein n=2 Tax=Eucalyptus grandis TaxID=71139 RepID=A0ACC3JLP6_EUCGR|nr:hypothetical protein EUGRSUZ_H00569 [Eucalyptus grandis]
MIGETFQLHKTIYKLLISSHCLESPAFYYSIVNDTDKVFQRVLRHEIKWQMTRSSAYPLCPLSFQR